MINSFFNEGSLVFQSREATRQKNEAFMLHVRSSLCFAHVPLLAQVVLSLKVSRVFVKCCLACFALVLLLIVVHVTPAFAATNSARNMASNTEPLIMMYGTDVHSPSFTSQVSNNVDTPPTYLSSMLSRPEPRKVGKVSFYAAMFAQNPFSLSIVTVPFGSESIMLALLAKNCLIGLTYVAAEHDPHNIKVRKKHEKLASPVDAHEASYHVDEIIDLDDDALSAGWLVSGSSPPETAETGRCAYTVTLHVLHKAHPRPSGSEERATETRPFMMMFSYQSALTRDEDITPLAAGVTLLLIMSIVACIVYYCVSPPSPLSGSMLAQPADRQDDTTETLYPPKGHYGEGLYLLGYPGDNGSGHYSLQLIEEVNINELHQAILHIEIRDDEKRSVPVFKVAPYTTVEVYSVTNRSYLSNTLTECTNQEILIRNGESYDRLSIQLEVTTSYKIVRTLQKAFHR